MANVTNEHATIKQRQLAEKLRTMRGDTPAHKVEEATRIKPSKLSRIETCNVRAHPNDVERLAEFYGASAKERSKLVHTAEEAYNSSVMRDYIGNEWAQALRGHLELEADAERIDSFTIDLVPGLLQTRDYTRTLIESRPDVDPSSIDGRLNFRDQRQARVTDGSLELWAVIGEAVLYQLIGSNSILADQLKALTESPPNVTVQVLPFSAGAHASLGSSFHIFNFSDHASIVYQDTIKKGLYQDDPETVRDHQQIMERTHAAALSPADSHTRLQERVDQLS